MRGRRCGVFVSAWVILLRVTVLPSQVVERTISDQVYTEAQAARGESLYLEHCRACHGPELSGGSGRPLRDEQFWNDWGEDSLESLFTAIRNGMPRQAPGTLTDAEYVDIVSYILKVNGLPAGSNDELTREGVKSVRVVRAGSAGRPPDFAMVTVFGCLGRDRASNAWVLTGASDPVRTRDPEARVAEPDMPGHRRFGLMFVPDGAALQPGRKASVTGLLIRTPQDERLNVTSVHATGRPC